MTPAARAQAAIELLDQIIAAAREGGAAADSLIARYFRDRRYAGSGDRRAVRELVYRAIRRAGEVPSSGRAALAGLAHDDAAILAWFDGSPHGPAPLGVGEPLAPAGVMPDWLTGQLDPFVTEDEREALLERAPLDLRVNHLVGTREEALRHFPDSTPTPLSPLGLRLAENMDVERSEAWRSGLVEVQDEGSQLLSLACEADGRQLVVDLCAGAGGKTLALAAQMGGVGRIIACDVDRTRLSRMGPRLERAGISNVQTRLLDPGREGDALDDLAGEADLVLVDAPCSGSGTWRRNPETRWRVTPERLARLVVLQARLLDLAAGLVRPGGTLVYAVCSLLKAEGREQVEHFADRHSAFRAMAWPLEGGRAAGSGHLLTPGHDGTDGFFIARWQHA